MLKENGEERRDIIIGHILDIYDKLTEYKKKRDRPIPTFISESEWLEIEHAYPQCCEPCTKTISQYRPKDTAVIHSVPGDHVNTMRYEIIALRNGYRSLIDKMETCNANNATPIIQQWTVTAHSSI